MLSREKTSNRNYGVCVIEEAMVVAARNDYKTEEDLPANSIRKTGQVDVFSVSPWSEEVADPLANKRTDRSSQIPRPKSARKFLTKQTHRRSR